ncbi:MAG: 1-acyl-sn-glycerol-3-phosphate acyltransferase [Herbaspirillum frisingense]|uniref:1-acyl-sn-glycerol-3-phosphate acyltransferase n=1 Tax=Herbaspirillum frisingense TaxID=92645 RepID=A0A7V8FTN0_9BURK|nr:MAG: 1-acyl-sn-glycerol-3-phosphate acyltransferase [Herbaspirillum frisingense]
MLLDRFVASSICTFARLLTGVRARWFAAPSSEKVRIYYPNHRSHGDFVLVWSSLPRGMRRLTRPVAGADYWLKGTLRRYVINRVFRGVLVDREAGRSADPIGVMGQALNAGESLIMFPEGTRNLGEGLLPFKSGLYHLARAHPDAELVPVWIENLGRAMPKGHLVPLPLLCTLSFGEPLTLAADEGKEQFLMRARQALLDLAPRAD